VTLNAIEAGDHWWCARCGQHWDANRLAVVAAYARWTADRATRRTEGRTDAPRNDTAPPAGPLGGRP